MSRKRDVVFIPGEHAIFEENHFLPVVSSLEQYHIMHHELMKTRKIALYKVMRFLPNSYCDLVYMP